MSDDEIDRTENEPSPPAPGSPLQPGPESGYAWAPPSAGAARSGRSRTARLFGSAAAAWIVAAVLALAVVGLSVALALGNSAPAAFSTPITRPGPSLQGPLGNRAPFGGNFAGLGVLGTVTSVGSGSFTVTDPSGQLVTVDEQSSTSYYQGATSTSSNAVVKGSAVLVLGSRKGNTVKATRVSVLPAGGFGGAGRFGGFGGPASR